MSRTILAQLEATIGTPKFDAIFVEMKGKLNKDQVADIAGKFVSDGGKSLSKTENLKRIYDRHANLITSAQKRSNLCRS